MAQIDGAGTGMGVQIERCIWGEAEFHAAGAGVHYPAAGGFALSLDAAAACLGLQGTMHVVQIKSAGAGFCADRAGGGLLEGKVAAAGFAVKPSSDSAGVNRPAARARQDAAAGAINVYVSRTRMGADAGADTGYFQAPRAGAGLERTGDAGNFLAARSGG